MPQILVRRFIGDMKKFLSISHSEQLCEQLFINVWKAVTVLAHVDHNGQSIGAYGTITVIRNANLKNANR